jgi:ribosomal protein S18 acetylase RimI-like enzyme
MLVATFADGTLVATSWMTFDGRRIHLHHFGVSPKFQRQGIGRQLAIASIAFAKEKGYQIKLEVHQTNTAAIKLYKGLGFQYLGDYDVYIIRSY